MKEGKSGGRVAPELVAEIESIARASDCELVQAELKGNVLRVILDKEEGISLGDCEQISKHVSAYLDVVDFGRSRYVLEVSSPGLDRQLYGPRDYARFVGDFHPYGGRGGGEEADGGGTPAGVRPRARPGDRRGGRGALGRGALFAVGRHQAGSTGDRDLGSSRSSEGKKDLWLRHRPRN